MNLKITSNEIIKILNHNNLLLQSSPDFIGLEFNYICYDSRQACASSLFFCKCQTRQAEYITAAKEAGATAYIAEKQYSDKLPQLIVKNVFQAMALISQAYYNYNSSDFTMFGVTGTKGKSTVVYFLANILEQCFPEKCAYLSTISIFDGNRHYEAELTTPESPDTYKYFYRARQNGVKNIVMELSSQAEKMQRLYGLSFKYGIFTNISCDHISSREHCSFEDYFNCKKIIISCFENCIINKDDPGFEEAKEAAKNARRIISYSLDPNSQADIYCRDIHKEGLTTTFTAVTPDYSYPMKIFIPGVFNVSNALAAIAAAYLMGLDKTDIAQALSRVRVSGRMECYEKDDYLIIVDYAHNKLSMSAALSALKEYYPDRRIITVFGCPGNKALNRRKELSFESVKYSYYTYITSEDPGFEDPLSIAQEIAANIRSLNGKCEIITDRRQAIKTAVQNLQKDQLLFIAGKGDEHYQLINGKSVAYEGDCTLVKHYINFYK